MHTSIRQLQAEPDPRWFEEFDHHHGGDDDEANPFLWVMVRMLRDFARKIRTCDFLRKSDFQHAMWILIQAGMPVSALSDLTEASTFAIERWANGRSSPTPMIRKWMITESLRILVEHGLQMGGKVYDPITGEQRVTH